MCKGETGKRKEKELTKGLMLIDRLTHFHSKGLNPLKSRLKNQFYDRFACAFDFLADFCPACFFIAVV